MNRIVQRILAIFFIVSGVVASIGYAVAILLVSDRNQAFEDWGALAGFSLFAAFIGGFWLLATFRSEAPAGYTTRLPPIWLSLILVIGLAAGGFGLDYADRALFLGPLLTILSFLAVGAFFLRIASRWMPERRLPLRNVVLPGAWGVFVAPVIVMILQGAALVIFLAAAFTGIIADNPDFEPDPNLEKRITTYIEESGSDATSTTVPDIVANSPTIALSLFSFVAVIAPLTEELVKALGAILLLSRLPTVTRADAFFAAVASSLGFALFEGVGYTLQAGAGWQQMLLVRAPVVIMHVAATTIVVIGWYRWRETGRGFIPYFVAGTMLHAGWNALYVGIIYSLTGIESGSNPPAAQAVSIMVMALLVGALFVAGFGWFVAAAHKAGHDERELAPPQESSIDFGRRTPLSLAADSPS